MRGLCRRVAFVLTDTTSQSVGRNNAELDCRIADAIVVPTARVADKVLVIVISHMIRR
jgi:hypothetical protein